MAMTMLQRIRLALRGWNRRREETAQRRTQAFLEKELRWGDQAGPESESGERASPAADVDYDGLQVAWLDDSGAFVRFLNLETGEVVEYRADSTGEVEHMLGDDRFCEVPRRSADSDEEDRRLFLERVDVRARLRLATALATDDGETEFRRILAADRRVEREWYNFKNDRALAAIEGWLRTLARPGTR